MGNKLGRRRQVVDDKYTRPQGLYQHKDVDQKKLRKLILDSKLAPCYPGDDDCGHELEECPICFLYYPSLNRSRCCTKGICTECFLQMKTPNSSRPTQCPFCKTSNYAVEYRGVKTKEEKGMEQIEEQRVIEAKIRMRQQEILDDEERTHKQQELSSSRAVGQQEILDDEERTHKQQELSSSRAVVPNEVESNSISVPTFTSGVDGEDIVPFQDSSAASVTRQPFRHRQNRDDEFDLDLEDIMVMEAIWLSIQEKGKQKNYSAYGDAPLSEQYMMSEEGQQFAESSSSASPSPSGGLACAIAALAEHQQTNGSESSSTTNYNTCNNTTTSAAAAYFPNIREEEEEMIQNNNYPAAGSSMEALSESQIAMTRVNGNWVSEMNTTYDSSTIVRGEDDIDEEEEEEDGGGGDRNFGFTSVVDEEEETQGSFQAAGVPPPSEPIVPESFEEQMMLAMAVSLAEARVRATSPSVAWQ